jgi:hypothetical protein
LCAFLTGNTQNKINKDITAHNETTKATTKAKNKPLPVVSGDTPSNQPNSSSHSEQHNKGPDHRADRIEVVPQADWWFKGYVIATFFIAGANIAVIIAVWRQKIVMSSQLDVMQQQVHNAAEQVIAAQAGNNRISHQIRLMQNANEQTNRLIEQATVNADAARKSADALVDSERAWIDAEFVQIGTGNRYELRAKNYGRTPGKITNFKCGARCIIAWQKFQPYVEMVTFPDNNLLLIPNEPYTLADFIVTDYFAAEEWTEVLLGTKQAIMYATVYYEDMIRKPHETSLCYMYRIPSQKMEEVREHRKYS